jgi:two-component system sensor histidine kinase UhpB
VARHADAKRVRISLERGLGSVVLRVADDGCGLRAGESSNGGGGIRGMRERAMMIGAALAIREAPAGGVEVRLEVPVATETS